MSHLKSEECLKRGKKKKKKKNAHVWRGWSRSASVFCQQHVTLNPAPYPLPFLPLFLFSILHSLFFDALLYSFEFLSFFLSFLPFPCSFIASSYPFLTFLYSLCWFLFVLHFIPSHPPSPPSSPILRPPLLSLPLNPADTKGLDRCLVNWRLKKYTSPFFSVWFIQNLIIVWSIMWDKEDEGEM